MNSSIDGPTWWTADLCDGVTRFARDALPNEVAGFWVLTRSGETAAIPLHCKATPHAIDAIPETLIEQVYAIWSRGDEVVGTFHSHPEAVHAFSERDRTLFEWGTWHLLISGIATEDTRLSWLERAR